MSKTVKCYIHWWDVVNLYIPTLCMWLKLNLQPIQWGRLHESNNIIVSYHKKWLKLNWCVNFGVC